MHQVLLSIEGFEFKITIKYIKSKIYFHHEKFIGNLPNMATIFCILAKFQSVLEITVNFSSYTQLRHFFTSFFCLKWLHLFYWIGNAQLTPDVIFPLTITKNWNGMEEKRPINQEAEETQHSTGQIHPRGKGKKFAFSILKSIFLSSEKGLLRPGTEEEL